MKLSKIIIIPLVLLYCNSLYHFIQENSYDTVPVFNGNTKEEFPKYIFSKIDKNKFKASHPYFFEIQADEKGKIINASLKNGDDNELAKEIIKTIKSMPNWTPAKKDGKSVAAKFIAPLVL